MKNSSAGPQWSHLAVEAALCVWEDMLARRHEFPERNPELVNAWNEFGTVHMRSLCPAIGSWIVEATDLIDRDSLDASPYDWEIVPAFVELVDWTRNGRTGHKPGLMAPKAAAKLIAERLGGAMAYVPSLRDTAPSHLAA